MFGPNVSIWLKCPVGCLGPTNAFFAFYPQLLRSRVGTGTSSGEISQALNEISTGTYELNSAALAEATSLSQTWVLEFTGISGSGTVRTIAAGTDGTTPITVAFNVSNQLQVVIGSATLSLGTGFDDGNTHRIAFGWNSTGDFRASIDGGTPLTGTGISPGALTAFRLGVDLAGTNAFGGQFVGPNFALSSLITDQQFTEVSDLNSIFICGDFPQSMLLGAFDTGFSDGFLI